MSQLTENPEMMLEALAALVLRAGGTVTIADHECPRGPFNLWSKFEPGVGLHLHLEEDGGDVAAQQ